MIRSSHGVEQVGNLGRTKRNGPKMVQEISWTFESHGMMMWDPSKVRSLTSFVQPQDTTFGSNSSRGLMLTITAVQMKSFKILIKKKKFFSCTLQSFISVLFFLVSLVVFFNAFECIFN